MVYQAKKNQVADEGPGKKVEDDEDEDLKANELVDPETLDDDEQVEANVKANADAIA